MEFFKVLGDMSKKKKSDDILRCYEYMKYIIRRNDFEYPEIDFMSFKYDIDIVRGVINIHNEEYPVLGGMKGVLQDNIYVLCNYI